MDADPFDPWYARQLTTKGANFNPEDWEFFGISHDTELNSDIQERKINMEEVDDWVVRHRLSKSPGVDLLLAQHKSCDNGMARFRWLPFGVTHFKSIFEALSLPAQYFYLRDKAGVHCNTSSYQMYEDAHGNISRISQVARLGHGSHGSHRSSEAYSSVWIVALTWDARTSRTVGFLEGFTYTDFDELGFHIRSCSTLLGHPLMLPEILLHMVTAQLNERARIPCEDDFYREECRTGLSSMPSYHASNHSSVWEWDFKDFQDATATANKCLTTMVFLQRRFRFTTQYAQRQLSLLAELKDSHYKEEHIKIMFRKTEQHWRQRLLNRISLLETYDHQTECVQKRIKNLNAVLYTVLSQIDSKKQGDLARIHLQIAQAVRSDSVPMRTIAYVTLLFLPGTLVATIFGMNFFQFDPTTSKILVANTFWQYWAVSVPITMLVIAVWSVWNFSEKRKGIRADKEMSFLNQKLYLNRI